MQRLLTIALFSILFVFGGLSIAEATQNPIKSDSVIPNFRLQIPIPGFDSGNLVYTREEQETDPATGKTSKVTVVYAGGIGQYIGNAYRWLTGAVAIVAVLVVMYAGFMWLTAGGNTGKTKHAKEMITNAAVGLSVLFGAYALLYFINPNLINIGPLVLGKRVETIEPSPIPRIAPASGGSSGTSGGFGYNPPPPDKVQMKSPYTDLTIPTSCSGRDPRMTPSIINAALDNQHKYGIPAAIILSQWALESAYGTATSGTNNYFGIKCNRTAPPCTSDCSQRTTQEQTKSGTVVTVQACFKNYATQTEGFEQHSRYLTLYRRDNSSPTKTGNWYDYNGDPNGFADFLQIEGYATDKAYAQKLKGQMQQNCLIQKNR